MFLHFFLSLIRVCLYCLKMFKNVSFLFNFTYRRPVTHLYTVTKYIRTWNSTKLDRSMERRLSSRISDITKQTVDEELCNMFHRKAPIAKLMGMTLSLNSDGSTTVHLPYNAQLDQATHPSGQVSSRGRCVHGDTSY